MVECILEQMVRCQMGPRCREIADSQGWNIKISTLCHFRPWLSVITFIVPTLSLLHFLLTIANCNGDHLQNKRVTSGMKWSLILSRTILRRNFSVDRNCQVMPSSELWNWFSDLGRKSRLWIWLHYVHSGTMGCWWGWGHVRKPCQWEPDGAQMQLRMWKWNLFSLWVNSHPME